MALPSTLAPARIARMPLSATVFGDHGRLHVALHGPLDGVSVRQVEDMIDWLAGSVSPDIEIDLHDVATSDTASMVELSAAARHLNSRGAHCTLLG